MKRSVFKWWWKETMLFDDLTHSVCEFQRVWTATEKAQVLTLGKDNKWKPNEQSSLGFGARKSMDNRYEGSPEGRISM